MRFLSGSGARRRIRALRAHLIPLLLAFIGACGGASAWAAAAAPLWPHDGKYGHGTRHLFIRNHLSKDIYIEVLSGGSSALKSDAFSLRAGGDTVYEVPNIWRASRLWGRTDKAQSGPSTLIEWTMGKRDWYDISLVDGYNLPVIVAPVPGTYVKSDSTDPFQCGSISCVEDLLPGCPEILQKKDVFGQVQQCLSACSKYNKDEFCCRGVYNSAEVCRPSTWEPDYPRLFKNACPTAVTYAFDDSTNNFICPSGAEAVGPDYEIGFGVLRASPEPNTRVASQSGPLLRTSFAAGRLRYAFTGAGEMRLALFGADGAKRFESPLPSAAGTFLLPALPSGVYRLVLSSAGRILETRPWVSNGSDRPELPAP